jgi:hypothetical protein
MAPAARRKSRRRSGTEGTVVLWCADRQAAPTPRIFWIIARIMTWARLGAPSGMQIYPMIAGKDDTGLG